MTPEELNREIADKLMGLTLEGTSFGDWYAGKEHYYLGKPTYMSEPLKNYFTEGWEQVEKWLKDRGFIVRSVCSKDGYGVEISWHVGKDKAGNWYGAGCIYQNFKETWEEVRHRATEQAWPEIVRRIENENNNPV